MKNLILINALIFLSISSFAQNYKFDWVRVFNGSSTTINWDIKCLATDNESNVYMLTMLYDTVDVDPSDKLNYFINYDQESLKSYIVKLDKFGNFILAFKINFDFCFIKSLFVDKFQNIYVTGSYLTAKGNILGYVNKYNKDGNLILSKNIKNISYGVVNSIFIDNEESIFIVGTNEYLDYVGQYPHRVETFIKKLDKNGDQIWGANIGGNYSVNGKCLKLDSKGNVIVGGTFVGEVDFDPRSGIKKITSDTLLPNGFILKLDPFGEFVWVEKIGGSSTINVNNIVVDKSDNVLLAGHFDKNVYFDSTKKFNTSLYSDIYISNVSKDGKYNWITTLGGNSYDLEICIDKNDKIFGYCHVTYLKKGNFKINASSYFLFKLDKNLEIEWGKSYPTYLCCGRKSLVCDDENNIIAAANFFKSCNFDPDNSPYILTTGTDPKTNWYKSSDFILKLKPQTTDNVDINNDISSFELYPNPTVSSLSVSKTADFQNKKYSIRDVLGRKLQDGILENQSSTIDVNNLLNGTYFIKIEGFATKKFIKTD